MKYLDCFLCYGIIIDVTSLKLTSSQCDVTGTPLLKNPAYATALAYRRLLLCDSWVTVSKKENNNAFVDNGYKTMFRAVG